MNKFLFFFALLFLVAPSANLAAQSPAVRMDFRLKGIQPGLAKLIGMYGEQNYLADSIMIASSDGFVYTKAELLPSGFYTWLLPGMKNFSLLIDKEQAFVMTGDLNDLTNTAKCEGSLDNMLFYETNRLQAQVDARFKAWGDTLKVYVPGSPGYAEAQKQQNNILAERKAALEKIYKQYPDAFLTKFKIAGQNPEPKDLKKPDGTLDTLGRLVDYRNRFFDGMDFTDERLLRTPVVANKLRRYIKDLTPQNPDSLIVVTDHLIKKAMPHKPYFEFFVNWIGLAHENTKTNVMDGEAVYVHIIKQYITKDKATWINEKEIDALHKKASEMEASLMGRKGPDVIANDVQGIPRSIYEKTAQLIVVFMYSPDCEHCREQAPEIKRIYQAWKSKGVDFYGIAVNTTDAEWRKFLAEQNFEFTNVFDPTNRAIYAKYFVDITPELYVLDQNRTIVAKNLKAEQLEMIFQKHLK